MLAVGNGMSPVPEMQLHTWAAKGGLRSACTKYDFYLAGLYAAHAISNANPIAIIVILQITKRP